MLHQPARWPQPEPDHSPASSTKT